MIKARLISKMDNKTIIGESYNKFIDKYKSLTDREKLNLRTSSISILNRCGKPKFDNPTRTNSTGLIIGKIQSGKTLSFTSLIALARDNGFRIVILISGRTNLLLNQTIDRVKSDLVKNDNKISIIYNPDQSHKTIEKIKRKLKSKSENNSLVILPILKHQQRIKDLRKQFQDPTINKYLQLNSVLIIDDEADQASLNTSAYSNEKFNLRDESAIFSSIKQLRYALPNHTYLQYTATPQGPLLIDFGNILSPDWHEIIEPGENYTGGQIFFDHERNIIETIDEDPNPTQASQSLKNCTYEYLILSAIMSGDIDGIEEVNDRTSMLVHPTWRVNETDTEASISRYHRWIVSIISGLESDIDNEILPREFENIFTGAVDRLVQKNVILIMPTLSDVVNVIKNDILDELEIHQVTGGYLDKSKEFPWDENRYHILVGGALLDRGFTVQNLISTYMPRDTKGTNQADTIEQRCRFYGYRKKYIDFCKVYISEGLKQDFESYNEHEEDLLMHLRTSTLAELRTEGFTMLMDDRIKATNNARLSKPIVKSHLSGFQYFEPQPPYINENNKIIETFINSLGEPKTLQPARQFTQHSFPNSAHNVWKINLSLVIDLLKVKHQYINNPREILKSLKTLQFLNYCSESKSGCFVLEIAPNYDRKRTIEFTDKPKNSDNQYKILTLPFGGYKINDTVYFADTKLLISPDDVYSDSFDYDEDIIMQIHKIEVMNRIDDHDDFIKKGDTFYTIAFNFPKSLGQTYISTDY